MTRRKRWEYKKEGGAKWVEPCIAAISKGYVDEIMEEIKEEYEKNPNERFKRLIGYLDRFRDALNF